MTPVFVFGSNLAGRHGKGAAKYAARHRGAQFGVGQGLRGNSYALPTKDNRLTPLSLTAINHHVCTFIAFAQQNPQLIFEVTRVGCGYAGYKDQDIAPMFRDAPSNCILPVGWRSL